jgi:hypothetical protein
MQSTEQPTDSQRNDGSCVRLSFNTVTQPGIECSRSMSSGISCLTVKILCGARRLIHEAFGFCLRIAGGTTDTLLNLAAEVSGSSPLNDSHPWLPRCECKPRLSRPFELTTNSTD